jgi:hypothetical protein
MATEIIVGKRGRITIPALERKKYRLEGRIKIIATEEGLLFQSGYSKLIWASFWEMIDANSDPATKVAT